MATLEYIGYYVKFLGEPALNDQYHWVHISIVNQQMQSRGLVDGIDYFFRWKTSGSPLPSMPNYLDGIQIARFTIKALAEMERFDIKMRIVDGVGDSHERIFPCINRLPSVTQRAIDNHREASGRAVRGGRADGIR
jgi:hypothetical protein